MYEDDRTVDELIELAEEAESFGLAKGMEEIRGVARGKGVALAVDLHGMLTGLQLTEEALSLGPEQLAAEIMRLSGEACTASLQNGLRAIEAGCGGDVAAAVVEFMPSAKSD